ncbi:baseplate J/gp47 family protein [Variovorax sp. J22R133]|uniref:baseplate J/gp47 family protein n=1 Tax=Variovorax brevis TaxID=3053503 RepID=UPI002574BE0E|nr:baseplate J/gp47 family protein [Variovorax sp. J22R133]MDM0110704.1 baseplate J/gp47 family protein [Variovorax sp. J22R133]
MSYVPRLYDEIVRDLLTTLTGGTVAESLVAPATDVALVPTKLRDRPVRRISHLEGFVGTPERQVRYRFTAADFELVSTSGDDNNKDALRFREGGRRPIPGTVLTVNYYPVATRPVPVNDLNTGSVVRTLMETIAFEQAMTYQHLDQVYRSAFIETAEGRSLDKVVALVGLRRLPAGHPVATMRFTRSSAGAGRIAVPASTAVTDDEGNRYLTQEELVLEPGEASRDVLAAGEAPGTAEVGAGALDRLEVVIAGIDRVSNPAASRRLGQAESDEELRRRSRGAFHGAVRGTLDALRFHLLSLEEVKDVSLVEEPNGVPGELRIDVAYFTETDEARARVAERIRQVKPAGIRVLSGAALRKRVQVRVALTLAGTGLAGPELSTLRGTVEQQLVALLNAVPPGGTVRRAPLTAAVMQDPRLVDARIYLAPEGGEESETLTLASGEVLDVATPIQFDTPQTETASSAQLDVQVSALLVLHLTAGTTQAQAQQALDNAMASHLATRAPDAPLSFDSLAAALRDDTRYALVRDESTVTVESGDRFFQLSDGVGNYAPAPNETLRKQSLDLQIREGGL